MTARLKLRVAARFLASIFAGTGTAVRKDGLATYVDIDWTNFTPISSIPDANESVTYMAMQYSVDGSWSKINITDFKTDLLASFGGPFQPLDADLTAIAGLTSAADRLPYFTGSGTAALATFPAYGRSLTAAASASAARVTLAVRDVLTADRTYAVSKTGSDSNTGLSTGTATVTFTNGSTNIGWNAHGRSVGDNFMLSNSGGALPTNFDNGSLYYVKTVTDANNIIAALTSGGTAITAGSAGSGTHTATVYSPFLTLQKAADTVPQVDLTSFSAVIQAGGGTYAENLVLPNYVSSGRLAQGAMIIRGSAGSHSSVVIQPASGNAVTAVDVNSWWTLQNLRINASGGTCINADHSRVAIDGVVFGAANIHKLAANVGAMIEGINNGYTIAVNAAVHDNAIDGGEIINQALTVTGTGSMTFASGFATSVNGGIIDYQGTTFAVTTTGSSPRFAKDLSSGIICTGGADPNATIPGTSNGTITGLSASVAASTRTAIAVAGRATDGSGTNVTLTSAALPFIQNTSFLGAARTWSLPAASSVAPGDVLTISDAGGINGANTITVQRGGADTFSGVGVSANAIAMPVAYSTLTVRSDGVSGWYLVGKT